MLARLALLIAGAYAVVGLGVAAALMRVEVLRTAPLPRRLALLPGGVCLWPVALPLLWNAPSTGRLPGSASARIHVVIAVALVAGCGLAAALALRPGFPVQPAIPGVAAAQ